MQLINQPQPMPASSHAAPRGEAPCVPLQAAAQAPRPPAPLALVPAAPPRGAAADAAAPPTFLWCPAAAAADGVDIHVAFVGTFELPASGSVDIDHVAVSWYNVWLDGARLSEGPTRFVGSAPYRARLHLLH